MAETTTPTLTRDELRIPIPEGRRDVHVKFFRADEEVTPSELGLVRSREGRVVTYRSKDGGAIGLADDPQMHVHVRHTQREPWTELPLEHANASGEGGGEAPPEVVRLRMDAELDPKDLTDLVQGPEGSEHSVRHPDTAPTVVDERTVDVAVVGLSDDIPLIAGLKTTGGDRSLEAIPTAERADGVKRIFTVSQASAPTGAECERIYARRRDATVLLRFPIGVVAEAAPEVWMPAIAERAGEKAVVQTDRWVEYTPPDAVGLPEEEFALVVSYHCGGGDEPITTAVAVPALEQVEPVECTGLTAVRCASGVLVELPAGVDPLSYVTVTWPDEVAEGWTRPAGRRLVEYRPAQGESLPDEAFQLLVSYRCDGRPFHNEPVDVEARPVGEPAPEPAEDGCCNAFRLPLRVETTCVGGGGSRGGELGAAAGGIVERFLPGASRPTDAGRLRSGLLKLLTPSPNGGGILAATLATAGAGASTTPTPWGPGPWSGGPGGYGGGTAMLAMTSTPITGGGGGGGGGGGAGYGPALVGATVSGTFAALRTQADVLETYALAALRDVQPILTPADHDKVEFERAIVEAELRGLIAEFRRDGGPELATANGIATRLPAHMTGLKNALGAFPTSAESNEDYDNLGRFNALQDWVDQSIALLNAFQPGADPREELADLVDLLEVVVESAEELESELTLARVDQHERRTIDLPDPAGGGGRSTITLAGLLEWIKTEAGQSFPALVSRAGGAAGGTIEKTLLAQRAFVDALALRTDFPWDVAAVQRAVGDLSVQLLRAADKAHDANPANVP